jgi:hypothetical protein
VEWTRLQLQRLDRIVSATPGPWRATPLRYDERDAIACLVDLLAFQLAQLSAGELQAATAQAEARVRQAGGVVILQAIDSRSVKACARHLGKALR